ncbi:MarR family transcriptional regulator [Paeniglutamicibacter sp. ANT13_2]|uniref:MarR family transcriptional regulator n=2 Tax=Paeniglutamicibacter terrestris TaxID=2723403 RepID=A0ABX1G845_9MICC|nr:MarR family transcriptional regulator [Paeniglutamicibacter terrestris]
MPIAGFCLPSLGRNTAIVQQRHGVLPPLSPNPSGRVAAWDPEDETLWSALAPQIAGQPRVRISRDGGKNYPQRYERDLTGQRPTQPAAVLIYGRDGLCRTLCLDFDSSASGGEARVAADVRETTIWLYEHGARWVEDHSPNGGRHIYVPLSEPMPFLQARDIVEALASRYSSLDPTPHQNLRHGCIRTPGATHKSGGRQQLAMSLSMALDVVTKRNTQATVSKLIETLTVDLAAVAAQRATTEKTVTVDPSVPPETISRRIMTIATHGTYDTSRYESPSEARQAVLVAAVAAGMQLTDVQRRTQQGSWPGLAQFYSRYSPGQRAASLRRDWLKASKFVANNTAEAPVRKTNTSGPSSQGGWGNGFELGSSQEHQFLRSWRSALALSEKRYQSSRSGLGRRLVLRALGAAAHMTGSRVIEFGVRSLAVSSGIEPTTVAAHLRALRSESDPLIRHVGEARGVHGDQYELVIPAHLQESATKRSWPAGKLHSLRPAFRELGAAAAFVYEALESNANTASVSDVVRETGLSRSAVHDALEVLAAWSLAERTATGWTIRKETSLNAVAEVLGVLEMVIEQVLRYKQQRVLWREWLAQRLTLFSSFPAPDDDYPWEQFCGPPDDWTLSDLALRAAS